MKIEKLIVIIIIDFFSLVLSLNYNGKESECIRLKINLNINRLKFDSWWIMFVSIKGSSIN